MQALRAEDFWQISSKLYASPGVKDLCLSLQDTYDLNVNMLLLCSFLQARGENLCQQQVHAMLEANKALEKETQAIRIKRRQMAKQDAGYQPMLAKELQMEKRQQEALINCLQACSSSQQEVGGNGLIVKEESTHNLWLYAHLHVRQLSDELVTDFIRLQKSVNQFTQQQTEAHN